jgi:phenylacetate-CoA ligase
MSSDLKQRVYAGAPVAVQNVLLSLAGYRLRQRRFGADFRRWMDLCRSAERWSPAEQGAYTDEQVRRIVRRAFEHAPYYRRVLTERHLRPEDIKGLADLPKLPILEKDDIRLHREEMVADDVSRRSLTLGHTSGTTGSPLEFWWDRSVEVATNAMIWRHRGFAGFRFGEPYATLLGRVIVPLSRTRPPFWRINRPWQQLFLSSFHMREQNLDAYIEAMRSHGAGALEAYPSGAYLLARHLEARGARLPLRAVFTSSETLLPVQRELIEDRFSCRVFDYYGQAERVMYSGECEAHEGHHHFLEYGALEIVGEDGLPLPPGTEGRLVLTGFANDAMPLIRYSIGDLAGLSPALCSCGRTLPLLSTVATKAEDIVVTPDGRFLTSSVLTHPFKPMHNVARSQIVQESGDRLRILIVPRPEYTDHDSTVLLAALRERVGDQMRIDIEVVPEIPLGARGKFRWVVSKVKLRFGGREVGNLYGE